MSFEKYSPWFLAAAIYNFIWGSITILYPNLYFIIIGIDPPIYPSLWRVIGMFVLVFAPAYWWASKHPKQFPHLILIGLLGKIFGPLGYLFNIIFGGDLPYAFGWTLITNDLIWWPAFILYLREIVNQYGFKKLVYGNIPPE